MKADGVRFGWMGTKFRMWMVGIIIKWKPRHIAFEAPWVQSGGSFSRRTSPHVPRMLIGLAWECEQIADEFGIGTTEAEPATWRKHFVGHGRPEDPKNAAMRQCALIGWKPDNHNEAEAAGLWSHTQSRLDPKFNYMPALFVGRPK